MWTRLSSLHLICFIFLFTRVGHRHKLVRCHFCYIWHNMGFEIIDPKHATIQNRQQIQMHDPVTVSLVVFILKMSCITVISDVGFPLEILYCNTHCSTVHVILCKINKCNHVMHNLILLKLLRILIPSVLHECWLKKPCSVCSLLQPFSLNTTITVGVSARIPCSTDQSKPQKRLKLSAHEWICDVLSVLLWSEQ